MNAGYFVGRVGGLAVALGVGAAVSFGCSTAWAADGTTDTGSVSSDSGAGSNIAAGGSSAADSPQDPGGSSADPGAGDTGDSTAPADADEADPASGADPEPSAQDPDPQPSTDVDSGTDEENADVADDSSDDAPTPVTHNKNRIPDEVPADDPAPEPDPAPVTRKVSAPDTEIDAIPAADGQSDPAPAVEPRSIVVNTIVTTPTTTPTAGGTDPVVAQPDPQADPAATTTELATAVAASLLGSNAPGDIPVNTPAEWIMLAAARRELADPDGQPATGTLGIQSLATPLAITPDAPTAAPDPIGDILTGAFQTITGILSTAASIARGTVTGALDLIGGIIDLAATATTVVLNTAINVVNWGISTTANLITGALATAVNALADAFDSSPTPLGDAIAGTLTFLNNVVSTTVNVLSQAATDVLSFTADGLSTAVTLLSDTVVGTLNLATQAVDIALQTINQILNPNSAPLAADDLANATEDTVALILAADLLANDTDPEADALSISALTQAAHGTTSKAANGDITYTPNTNFNGTDTFTYTITDGAKTSTATVTVIVTPVNDAPVGVNDTVTTAEDTPKTITADSLLANDSDPEDDPFSITAVGQGTRGTTGRAANGDIIYTPGLNVSGTDTFTYTISDGAKSSTATVTVTITPVNDAPIAGSDTATTAEDTPTTITATTLLANDSDPDHDALSITAAGQGVHGATTRAANGDITYAPNANFNGTDTFTYTITDGAKTSTATVTVTVTPVNDAPAAVNDTASTTQGVAVTLAANTLLANDSDVDTAHNALSITATTQGAHGTTSRATNGDVVYTPDATFAGTDSFTYTVSDGALSSTATVTVTVTGTTPIEHSPVANNDNATTDEDTPKTITANTLLANDSDADNDTLTITATTQGAHGTTSKAANGDITYTPNANFNGPDTFTYTITDGTTTSTATVTVTITPVNDAPAGVNDIASTTQGLAIILTANTLLANDTDVDTAHSALSITAATQGAHGTTSKAASGDITYTPDATFAGTDTFTYTVSDGALSSTAQVAVTVIPAHVAGDHTATTAEDASLTLAPNTLLGNESDTVSDVGAASHGITSRADDGTITYTPALNFNGTDFFTYTASDGQVSNTATIIVTVTPVNDAPVAVDDTQVVNNEEPNLIEPTSLLRNDFDPDADTTLSIVDVGLATHGTTSRAEDGTITYTAELDYNGNDSFTYTVTDGILTSTATVTVSVGASTHYVPTAGNDYRSTDEDISLDIDPNSLLSNDNGVGTLSITAVSQGAYGTTSRANDGTITYTPQLNFNGTDTFTYTVSDGSLTATAAVIIQVEPVSDGGPIVGNDIVTAVEDTALTIPPNTLLENDADVDNDVLSIVGTTPASHGTVSRANDGTIIYTPALNFNGTDTFTYTVSDGYLTGVGTVTVTVTPVNDAPTNGSSSSGAPNAITGVVIGSVSADDPDDDTLTYSAPATTAKGSITLVGNTFTYTPTAAARTAAEAADASVADKFDVFTVTASDGHGQPLAIPVTVTVAPPTSANIGTGSLAVHRVIAMSGTQFGIIALNGDGSRAIVEAVTAGNSDSGQIALINTITGSVIKTFTLDGAPSTTDRAYFTNDSDYVVVAGWKHTLILNAAGEQVGDALPGTTTADVDLNKATGQLVITNGAWVTLINDLATGDPVVVSDPDSPYVDDDVVELDIVAKHVELAAKDYPEWYSYYAYDAPVAQLSEDGSHLVIMVSGGTYFAPDQVRTALIDAHTGELISGTLHTIRTSAQEGAIVVDPRPAFAGATIATDEDGNPVINNDGTRLLIERLNRSSDPLTGYAVLSTDLMVVDTTTGQQVGSTITVDGRPIGDAFAVGYYTATLAANGTEAIVTITTDDYIAGSTGSGETSVIVINMEDGRVLGTITEDFTLPMGSKPPVVRFSTDGGKAVVLETNGDAVIIDHGGSQVGSTISLPGAFANFSADISADGSLAVVSGSPIHSAGGDKTYVQLINAATGAAVGETFVANGSGTATLNAAHTRVIVSTDQGVSVLNTATGAQVGTTIAGTSLGTSADGSRALVATVAGSEQSGYTSTLRVVNTLTGAIIGAPVVVPGTVKVWTGFDYSASASFNSSGTRAIVTTSDGSGSNIKLAAIDLDAGALAGGIASVNGYVRQAATFAADSSGFLLTSSTAGSTSASTSGSTALVTGFAVT